MPIDLPAMLSEQQKAWHAVFEIHTAMPYGWVLVGGQAVCLHAIERSAPFGRPTKGLGTERWITSGVDGLRSSGWQTACRGDPGNGGDIPRCFLRGPPAGNSTTSRPRPHDFSFMSGLPPRWAV